MSTYSVLHGKYSVSPHLDTTWTQRRFVPDGSLCSHIYVKINPQYFPPAHWTLLEYITIHLHDKNLPTRAIGRLQDPRSHISNTITSRRRCSQNAPDKPVSHHITRPSRRSKQSQHNTSEKRSPSHRRRATTAFLRRENFCARFMRPKGCCTGKGRPLEFCSLPIGTVGTLANGCAGYSIFSPDRLPKRAEASSSYVI